MKLLPILAMVVAAPLHAYEMEEVKRIDFEVRDPATKELYLSGTEDIVPQGGSTQKEARYFDLQKTEVQYELVVYDNQSLRVQNYRFKNPITGEETEMVSKGDQALVKYRESSAKELQEGKIEWGSNAYHGKVFNNMILRNWASLLKGQPLLFDLLLPSHFKSISFRIVYKNSTKIEGEDREVFVLEPTSLIIRALAPHMEFQYTKGEKPRIRQFSGPCTIPIKGKKDRMVDIIFSYPKV